MRATARITQAWVSLAAQDKTTRVLVSTLLALLAVGCCSSSFLVRPNCQIKWPNSFRGHKSKDELVRLEWFGTPVGIATIRYALDGQVGEDQFTLLLSERMANTGLQCKESYGTEGGLNRIYTEPIPGSAVVVLRGRAIGEYIFLALQYYHDQNHLVIERCLWCEDIGEQPYPAWDSQKAICARWYDEGQISVPGIELHCKSCDKEIRGTATLALMLEEEILSPHTN